MGSYREHRDRLKRQQRISLMRRVAFFTISGMLLFTTLFILFKPIYREGIRGTVIRHRSDTSGTSSLRYWVVRLDNGTTVNARVIGRADYRPGHRVLLKETSTRFFSYKWYQFKAYIEEPTGTDKSSSQG